MWSSERMMRQRIERSLVALAEHLELLLSLGERPATSCASSTPPARARDAASPIA